MKSMVLTAGVFCSSLSLAAVEKETPKPDFNILLIYADDVGYGDLGCYGATAVRTPNIDKLAAQGRFFTQAYATTATCTPSRYGLLTGQYPWRKPGTQVLPGNAASIIETGRQTLPSMLKQAGFTTGLVGKWHLGLGDGKSPVDFNTHIKPGPNEIGFDSAFFMPATNDRVPCVYVQDGRVVNLDPDDPIQVSYGRKVGKDPTGTSNPEMLRLRTTHGHNDTIVNGVSRIGFMSGGHAARWKDEQMVDLYVQKSAEFMENAVRHDSPFFLMFSSVNIHVPRLPAERFKGTSRLGSRGDVIHEFDASVGALIDKLRQLGISDKTLVILSSDNGPFLDDGYADSAVILNNNPEFPPHRPTGLLSGHKYSLYEGGCRIPLIVSFPNRLLNPGQKSEAIVSQLDIIGSLAPLCHVSLDTRTVTDATDQRRALFGNDPLGREWLVEQGSQGLALRYKNYKFIPKSAKIPFNECGENDFDKNTALFDLSKDPAEKENIAVQNPDIVKRCRQLLNGCTQGQFFLR